MSDSDGCEFDCTCSKCKGKKRVIQIAETSDSDSPFENAAKRKKVLRVMSDGAASSSDSDAIIVPPRKRTYKRAPRVESDEECSSPKTLHPLPRGASAVDSSPTQFRKKRSAVTVIPDTSGSESESDDLDESFGTEHMLGLDEEEEEEDCSGLEEEDETDEDYEGGSSSSVGWESDWASQSESGLESDGAESDNPLASMVQRPAYVSAQPVDGGGDTDSSGDASTERCPICLRSFGSQEVATPAACDHSFCALCLQEWAKNINTCPVDRQTFTLMSVRRRLGGKVVREVAVSAPPTPADADDDIVEDPTFCELCNGSDGEDRMLLCDGCDAGYHLDCLTPPLETVPVEQWFCPECVTANGQRISGESGIADGELMDLLEDAHQTGFSPLHMRVQRLLPRTRQTERVRATIRSRVQTEPARRSAAHQPSTSSGIDSQGSTRFPGFFGSRPPAASVKKKEKKRRKRRVKAKSTAKRKSSSATGGTRVAAGKKRKKTKSKRKVQHTYSSTSSSSDTEASYVRRRRRPRDVGAASAPRSVKSRLADQLGIRPPKLPGQLLPRGVRKKGGPFARRHAPAAPLALHIFGQPNQLDYFPSGSDEDAAGGTGGSATGALRRPRTSAARHERNLANRKLLSPGAALSHAPVRAARTAPAAPATMDLIAGILDCQTVWHSRHTVVSINRDRSFSVTQPTASRRLFAGPPPVPGRAAPVDVNAAPASTTQAPMFPDRRGGGSQPSGGGFDRGGRSYEGSRCPGAGFGGGGGRGPSPLGGAPPSDGRADYADFLHGGPAPACGAPPAGPRRPAPRRPAPAPRPPGNGDELGWKSEGDDEDDEDEIDIYSDIEVAGAEAEAEALAPPPPPPPCLLGSAGDAPSDDDSGAELVIDDNVPAAASPPLAATSPPAASPANGTADGDEGEEPAEKYDPAEPCDSDDGGADAAPAAAPAAPQHADGSNSAQEVAVKMAVKSVLESHLRAGTGDPGSDDEQDDEQDEECPNFSIYSAVSMDIARHTDSDPVPTLADRQEVRGAHEEARLADDRARLTDDQVRLTDDQVQLTEDGARLDDEKGGLADKTARLEDSESSSSSSSSSDDSVSSTSSVEEPPPPPLRPTVDDPAGSLLTVVGLRVRPRLAEHIFASDDDSLVGGATSPVSAASSNHAPPGLEGLDTEAVSEPDEAAPYDELSETSFATADEDGEIALPRRPRQRRKPADYEEGEIVEERPKVAVAAAKEADGSDENAGKRAAEDGAGKKPVEKRVVPKDRPVLAGKENKGKAGRERAPQRDAGIAWKKPSKARERNYRDGKDRPEKPAPVKEKEREKEREKDKEKERKEKGRKEKERRKKDKRQDMERYNVRKMVDSKRRSRRRDAFGRDLSRDRSHTRSRSRRSRAARDRSPPPPPPRRSRSASRRRRSPRGTRRSPRGARRSRSRPRQRARSRSPARARKEPAAAPVRPAAGKRRSPAASWTPSWSRSPSSRSGSSRRETFRSFTRSWSRSWSPDVDAETEKPAPGNGKKLTVTVTNTAEPRKKKRKEKKKAARKKAVPAPATEKRRKRKDKSPPPSKEVFTSGDNILVSVSFNKSAKQLSKEAGGGGEAKRKPAEAAGAAGAAPAKKARKGGSPAPAAKTLASRLGAKKARKPAAAAPRLTRVQAAARRKPLAIIDLDQSPFREQTPSPADLIVLSDSDEGGGGGGGKQGAGAASPKGSSKTGTNTATNVSESQSPASGVGIGGNAYLPSSTGPKTPPEPQVKFCIAAKTTLRSIMNPLREEDDDEEEEGAEGAETGEEAGHKGPNTPPEPRGPSTPCFSPTSPDAYDPFDPTKSNSPSPARDEADGEPSSPAAAAVEGVGPGVGAGRDEAAEGAEAAPATADGSPAPAEAAPRAAASPPVVTPPPAPAADAADVVATAPPPAPAPAAEPEAPAPERHTPPKPSPAKAVPPPLAAVVAPVFALFASGNMAGLLRTPPPPLPPPPRLAAFNPAAFGLPPPFGSPLRPPAPAKPAAAKAATTVKSAVRTAPLRALNGEQKAAPDKTDVVDMELESPYSPASSEANDLFNPPTDAGKARGGAKKHKSPLKPAEKFDSLFGISPAAAAAAKGKRGGGRAPAKHAAKNSKKPAAAGKHDGKGKAKKEIGVKMNEDKLQILDELPSSAVELQVKDKYLKKLNRQERVVEEVKLSLKPHYAKKHVTKEEYKDILRRSVPKICHNKSGEINPQKIASLVEAYVKKARYNKKKPGSSAKKGKTQAYS